MRIVKLLIGYGMRNLDDIFYSGNKKLTTECEYLKNFLLLYILFYCLKNSQEKSSAERKIFNPGSSGSD